MSCSIFIELYVRNIPYNIKFFTEVLNFTLIRDEGDFAELQLNDSILLLNDGSDLDFDHPFRGRLDITINGIGAEIGIAVAYLDDVYKRAKIFGDLKITEIKLQDWGLRDFRIITSDDYYLRITEPPK